MSTADRVQEGVAAARDRERDRIRRVLAGDQGAFEELFDAHYDRLRRSMVSLTRDDEEAEDVVQEAILQAYLKLAGFRSRSAFGTWLYAIALNIVRIRRRRRRTWLSLDALKESAGLEVVAQELPSEVERAENAGRVRQALNALPSNFRTILLLREFDGLTYETISELLDLPIGTVRSRLHRARMMLKDDLSGE
ncbi:MAG: sigma-70 family RNA polymerase sigma factor [Pirellulales bacterium]|nr:sigma-70 family RNA polymerase sigma factor [Pirellulales bacterium]